MVEPIECPECGKRMDPRGLAGHRKFAHSRVETGSNEGGVKTTPPSPPSAEPEPTREPEPADRRADERDDLFVRFWRWLTTE